MIWADIAILVLVGISMLISLWRGFMREAMSLLAWVAAFWVGLTFAADVAVYLVDYLSVPSARLVVSFLVLFLLTLFVGGMVNYLVGKLVDKTGLTGSDRMVGVLFGLARGIVLVAILVLLAGLTPLPSDPWWHQSIFIEHFQTLAVWMRSFLPPEIGSYIRY